VLRIEPAQRHSKPGQRRTGDPIQPFLSRGVAPPPRRRVPEILRLAGGRLRGLRYTSALKDEGGGLDQPGERRCFEEGLRRAHAQGLRSQTRPDAVTEDTRLDSREHGRLWLRRRHVALRRHRRSSSRYGNDRRPIRPASIRKCLRPSRGRRCRASRSGLRTGRGQAAA
jgi:hypothetical protein